MRNHNTNLQIASTWQRWQEVNGQVDHAVANLVNGDLTNAERLLLLLDLMTGEQYDPQQREMVAFEIRRRTFTHTLEFETALENYLDKINPSRVVAGPRAIKTA